MSIYHSKNQTNQYNSKEEYRDKNKNGWHYTYIITVDHQVPDEPRKYYIGVRTSEEGNLPEEDIKYLSSSVPLTEFLEEYPEAIITKTILACFLTREDAAAHEIELHAEFKVASNTEYFNLAEAKSTGFSIFGTTQSEEERQKRRDANIAYNADPVNATAIAEKGKKISDWFKNPENADAIEEWKQKRSDATKAYYADPVNSDAIDVRNKKISDWSKNPENANAMAEHNQKISDWYNDPANADAIAEAGKKISEKGKAYRADPANADAIAERNKKISKSKKGKTSTKFVCRISDRREYRTCDITNFGLEKLGLV